MTADKYRNVVPDCARCGKAFLGWAAHVIPSGEHLCLDCVLEYQSLVEVRKMVSDERQYAFFRIAAAMGEMYELERMRDVLNQMEPSQLAKMVDDAIERGDSRVMITDKAYIDFDLDEVQSSRGKAK